MNQSKQKMGTLKRGQQNDKKTNANLLEEARKREEKVSDDASQLKVEIGLMRSHFQVDQ